MMGIALNKHAPQSLQLQLTVALRNAVGGGGLPSGSRLPPSRTMARELGVSRNLVTAVYDQLAAEGYLEGVVGRGTFVTAQAARPGSSDRPLARPGVGGIIGGLAAQRVRFDFTPGRPDLSSLPKARWAECLKDGLATDPEHAWGYGTVIGEAPLRREIAAWLFRIRGLDVHPDRILVTSGTAQSLLLLALTAARGTDGGAEPLPLYCEDPSIPFAAEAFRGAGCPVRPLGADQSGDPVPPKADAPGGWAYLNPSNRFPRGGPLPPKTRESFCSWVRLSGSMVIEDDYDAEFRRGGLPLEPMVSADPERTVYMGSFSKCLFPALRIGYFIAPDKTARDVASHKASLAMKTPPGTQRALARFLERGYLDRHVRAMKTRYAARSERLVDLLDRRFGGAWTPGSSVAGFHLSAGFQGRVFDEAFFDACRQEGIAVKGEGHYSLAGSVRTRRLVLGFGNLADERLEDAVRALASRIEAATRR